MLASLLLLLASEAAAPAAVAASNDIAEPDPKQMSRSEINKFNARISRNHPYFIRCVRGEETGSLVKKIYSCRTNAKWALAERVGSENARDTLEAMKGKSLSGN